MANAPVKITASYANGKTLDEFSRVISKRSKYLNETAFQSIHAMAVETLKSIRSMTRVARKSSIKISLKPRQDLQFSYYYDASHPKMCLRSLNRRYNPAPNEKIRFSSCRGHGRDSVKVFEFIDDAPKETIKYLIAAPSQAIAKKDAQKIVASRLLRYAGLAKRAISALMIKTNNRGPSDPVPPHVYAKANEVTFASNKIASNSDGSGKYTLTCLDNLRYAVRAIKGGQASVDLALKRAANKSIGLIHHKCKDLLLPGELKTPFPEITKKGGSRVPA